MTKSTLPKNSLKNDSGRKGKSTKFKQFPPPYPYLRRNHTRCGPDRVSFLPACRWFVPALTHSAPIHAHSVPDLARFVRTFAHHVPALADFVPDSARFVPASAGFVPALA